MSDLFSSLSLATRGLAAQQAGLNAAGQNIANVNTPGYTRRTVLLAPMAPTDATSAGNGVDVVGVHAERADLLNAQLRREQPAQAREVAVADQLSQVESSLGKPGASLDASLTDFYNSFSQLAMDPSSGVTRQQVVVQGQTLAGQFNDMASRLVHSLQDADAQVRSAVDQINGLAGDISSLNNSLAGAAPSAAETLRDELGQKLDALSQLVDVGIIPRPDGGADVTLGNGHPLVIGASAFAVGLMPRAGSGVSDVTMGGTVFTNEITGGKLGGMIQVRDVMVPQYQSRLDQLAYGVATSVNTAHRAGFDLSGTAGGDFFTPPAAAAGAAAAMSVSAAVVADPGLVAAAGSANPGDNTNARALANLAQAAIAGTTTNPTDTWGALIYRVGTDSATAKGELKSRDQIVQQLQTLRDQIQGVSLDEEAVSLTKFQRAYEANARFFSAIQTSLDVLMQLAGQ